MVNVNCLNNIASVGLDLFSDDYNTESSFEDAQAVLVRSAKMHDMELGDNLLAIARAGAGVNNIPLDKCAESGIVVFNTPGANANAVKEQVLAAMLLASRDLIGGNEWVKANKDDADIAKATEKAKKAFAGQEIKGKKLGVIGLGAIGQLVANAAIALGMEAVESEVMTQKPKPKSEGLFAHGFGVRIVLQGVMFGLLALFAFMIGEKSTGTVAGGQTMAFAVLALSQVIQAYNMRSEHSLFKIGMFTNKKLNQAALLSIVLVLAVLFTPLRIPFGLELLSLNMYLTALGMILIPILVMEFSKAFGLIRHQH